MIWRVCLLIWSGIIVAWGQSKSTYAQFHRFWNPSSFYSFLRFQGTPPPKRTYFQVNTLPPPKHLLLLSISVTPKFAEFVTNPRTLEIIKCLYKNKWECYLASIIFKRQFCLFRMLAINYPLKITWTYLSSLKNPPLFYVFVRFWDPPPLQGVRNFEWPLLRSSSLSNFALATVLFLIY